MAIGANSYGSVAEVVAFTRRLLDDESTYNSTTIPTLTDVETMIDRASGVLNTALATAGFSVPVSQATAKLACDDWVVRRTVVYVELTQPGAGYELGEGGLGRAMGNLTKQAAQFVRENTLGFKWLGVGVSHPASEGLVFTAEQLQADRADPDDSSLEQPKFSRGEFDA